MSMQLEKKIDTIKLNVLKMAYLVRDAIANTVSALEKGDPDQARRVIEGDAAINAMLKEIDQEIIRFQALEQPVASDLRFSMTSTRVVILLEHIGDQALSIADHVLSMAERQTALPPCPPLDRLVSLTQKMYDDAIKLYTEHSGEGFEHFSDLESEISELVTNILRFYVNFMIEQDRVVEMAISMIIVSRSLKTICDYTMNIVENILFVVYGISVDHICTPV
jgi:phosphate transport system protein